MRSVKSWFNATLYKKNLTRFWPVWALYLVIWLGVFPGNLMLGGYTATRFAYRYVLQCVLEAGLPMAVIFSLLVAMAVWSYLFNNRSTCLMHTLPIRREGLFLTNFLSGLTMLIGPNLAVFVLTLLAEGAAGVVSAGRLAMWLVCVSLMELFFFCFATFCVMFTGHVLALPAFYAILNGLFAGLTALVDTTLSRFVFGYSGIDPIYAAAEWLTPVGKLAGRLNVMRERVDGTLADSTARLEGWEYILIYAVVGLVFAALALLVYRRRDMERAGDVVTVPWVRPVFQYGVAFCCASAFGVLLFEVFRYAFNESAWLLLAFMIFCGAVGYFAAKMLLEKSFRVFRCWKGYLPLLAVLVVLVAGMELDVTGYERRVPGQDQVAQVEFYAYDTRPYDKAGHIDFATDDPEVIRAVLDVHQAVVTGKKAIEADSVYYDWEEMPGGYTVESTSRSGFQVTYTLTDGRRFTRDYLNDVPVYAADQNNSNSITGKLNALVNLPQAVDEAYGLADESAGDIIAMHLNSLVLADDGYSVYETYEDIAISEQAYGQVLRAVQADLAAGNLGRRYLLDDETRMNTCFGNDLEITFYRGMREETSEAYAASVDVRETMPVPTDTGYYEDYGGGVITERISITLQTTATRTLAELQKAGVLTKPVNLYTQAQRAALDEKWGGKVEDLESIDLSNYAWGVLGE